MSSVTAPTSAGLHLTARTGGQVLIDQLFIHGVDHVFGVPGESYLAALDALQVLKLDGNYYLPFV